VQKKRVATLTVLLLRLVLGVVFIYAAADKILRPAEFARAVANYQILPSILINPAALLLPWVEAVCGLALLSGRLIRGSAAIISTMLIIFIAALAAALWRGLDISCGCFSLKPEQASDLYMAIARDLLLLAMALWLWLKQSKAKATSRHYDLGQ
jgi:uncharacterized membrane protein YphA (DoxX/SURF4 family)